MYCEEDFLQLSALQHFIFCPRQCALIHIEQIWLENRFTAEGRIMHEQVDREGSRNIKGVRVERGVYLRSAELGLIGKADVVEFHRDAQGRWVPFPVEYKRGRPKPDDSDKTQLCAQGLCLEEMTRLSVPEGALFYGKPRRRMNVVFDESLRQKTKDAVRALHEFINKRTTPKPVYVPKCDSCSFVGLCLPKVIANRVSVEKYIEEGIRES
ncbi:MAG: CRISPR-associated protein Cas4 [Candidatus Omnitrophota bacterium]